MMRFLAIFLFAFSTGCFQGNGNWKLIDENGSEQDLSKDASYLVIMFISSDCPLSQLYAKPFTTIADSFPEFRFMGVVPGIFDNDSMIHAFAEDHGFGLQILRDPDYSFARELKAEVTPEFFVISPDKNIVYHGAMDDWAIDLARKKIAPQNHYLMDALDDISHDRPVAHVETVSVGCIIEYSEK